MTEATTEEATTKKPKLTATDKLKRAEEALRKARKGAEGERIKSFMVKKSKEGKTLQDYLKEQWNYLKSKTLCMDEELLLNELIRTVGIKGLQVTRKPPAPPRKKKETTEEAPAEATTEA
jgi:uncharacterized protein YicC (UPF0701 family)